MLFRRRIAASNRFGEYQIIRLVHEGHKAQVFQARYGQGEPLYAVKLYNRAFDAEMRRLRAKYGLWTEGEIGQAMNPTGKEDAASHPIVRTVDEGHEYGNRHKPYYVVQEFIEGSNLKNLLTVEPAKLDGRRLQVAVGIARGLDIIHRSGFVHRDLCSDNVLLSADGAVKLIDLGFCAPTGKRFEEKSGTPSYMAPEQIRAEPLTPAADIYSFGVVLYELFTGRLPFGSGRQGGGSDVQAQSRVLAMHLSQKPRPPWEVNPACPPAIGEIILRCLAKSPEERYADPEELLRALREAGEERAAPARDQRHR